MAVAVSSSAAGRADLLEGIQRELSFAPRLDRSKRRPISASHYQPGDGIIYSFGDLTGVLREAGIPLRDGLHQGNHPSWDAAVLRPDLFFHEEWALAIAGDQIAEAVVRTGAHYRLKKRIKVEGAPAVEIYRRQIYPQQQTGSHEDPVY